MAREFGLGYLPPPPDGRNHQFLARAMMSQVAAAKKPAPRKAPYKEGPILDQGPNPHCVGFSSRGLLNASPIMVKPDSGPSGSEIYKLAQELDEWPGNNYDGSSVNAGCKALKQLGYIEGYAWFTKMDQIIEWVNGGYGTVLVGTNWYDSMDNVDRNGLIVAPSRLAKPVGGHAYRLNWFDIKKKAFLVPNTWGRKWGMPDCKTGELSGTAYMPLELGERLFFKEEGEVTAPTEIVLKAVRA